MKQELYHISVLPQEVLDYMAPKPGGIYVDVTFGGGGHTRSLLEQEPKCSVIALDWDKKALELNAPSIEEAFPGRITFIWGNFARLDYLLHKAGIKQVDGILADFGTSQYQIKERAGFSFAKDTPLDMRMSPGHQKITAADIINKASEQELYIIFKEYGEERHARALARAICDGRKERRIKTTGELTDTNKPSTRF